MGIFRYDISVTAMMGPNNIMIIYEVNKKQNICFIFVDLLIFNQHVFKIFSEF